MASIRQSIRSSTTSKRPTSAIADGQIALNTASGEPGLFFKDNANNIIKTGPAHYGASAPNVSPAVGGSTGNSLGEAWLDSALTPPGWKIWSGTAWVNATPLSSDAVQGLVELATNAETQAGVDTARAVTSASLQSKVSDSISTASASGIASSTAVKTAYDLANAALPKSGGIITGNLEIGSTGSLTFEGSTADGFETTLAVVDPTVDRTITFPNITGTVVTTGDSGTVTSTMIADGTIVNADVSTSAAIAFSKLASLASANILVGNASGVATSTVVSGDVTITNAGVTSITSNVIVNADINSAAAIAYSKLALSSGITNTDISASAAVAYSKLALSNSIVNADINSAAAIAGTKISPDFGSQNLTTTGNITAANHITASGTATSAGVQVGTGTTYKPGIYSPGADQLAISTSGTGRVFVDSLGRVGIGTSSFGAVNHLLTVPSGSYSMLGGLRINGGDTSNSIYQSAAFGISSDNYITFSTNASLTERLRLTSTGALNFVGAGTAGSTQAVSFNGSAPVNSLVIDSSGNLGLGVTPSAWNTAGNLQLLTGGNIAAKGANIAISANQFYNGTNNIYVTTSQASAYTQDGGAHKWYNAPSGTAGNTITFTQAMTLDASGRLGIGTTTPSYALDVSGTGRATKFIAGAATDLGLSTTLEVYQSGYVNLAAFRSVPNDGINPYLLITSSSSGITLEENGSSYGSLMLKTGGTERLRLTSTGALNFVGAGTAGSTQAVSFNGSAPVNSLVIDSSGNLGLGVVPSAWGSPFVAMQISTGGAALTGRTDGQQVNLSTNWRFASGSNLYISNGFASRYLQESGIHSWLTAPSGTAGNTITFTQAMTLDASGRLGIGTTSPSALLHVYGGTSSNTLPSNFQGIFEYPTNGGIGISTGAAYVAGVYFPYSTDPYYAGVARDTTSLTFRSGGSERARIDSSGRLLVGTSSTSATQGILCQATASADGAILLARNSAPSATQTLGYLAFSDNGHVTAARIAALRDSGTWTAGSSQPSALVFSTTADGAASPTEAMRITSAQNIRIGTTGDGSGSTTGRIRLTGNAGGINSIYTEQAVSGGYNFVSSAVSNGGTYYHANFLEGGTQRGSITSNGVATVYATTSDYRLKENVAPVSDGITRFKQLKPSRFNFISHPDRTVDGFLAHEAQEIVPECVIGTKDEVDADGNPIYQGIDQSKLVPLLTAALQEAIAKIEALEARLTAAGIA